jgi:pimeloyl-ACP methyl ester carboxylesterase
MSALVRLRGYQDDRRHAKLGAAGDPEGQRHCRYAEEIEKIQVPTLIVHGDRDASAPIVMTKSMPTSNEFVTSHQRH